MNTDTKRKQKAVVVGAGVVGLMQAYSLWKAGCDVTVVDKHHEVAAETSRANGAQISPHYVVSFAGPHVLEPIYIWNTLRGRGAARIGFDSDQPVTQAGWIARLMGSSPKHKAENSLKSILQINEHAAEQWQALLEEHPELGSAMQHGAEGKLVVYPTKKEADEAARTSRTPLFRDIHSPKSTAQAISEEPFLTRMKPIGGAISTRDEVGDPYLFAQALQSCLEDRGVTFKLGYEVTGASTLSQRKNPIDWIRPPKETVETLHLKGPNGTEQLDCDTMVLCAGGGTPALSEAIGGPYLPIYPVHGGILTYDVTDLPDDQLPTKSITNKKDSYVVTLLRGADGSKRFRISGGAVVGTSEHFKQEVYDQLTAKAEALIPELNGRTPEWHYAARHCTPDQVPILDRLEGFANVYVNAGHAGLGWTQSPGAADIVTRLMTNQKMPERIEAARFRHNGHSDVGVSVA